MASEFEKYVVDGLINFYNDNDTAILDEYIDENVTYYGPKAGQTIIGKENLLKSLTSLNDKFRFFISNISTRLITYTANQYSIMVNYKLYAMDKRSRNDKVYYQRMITNGMKCRDKSGEVFWKCPFICIDNLNAKESNGVKLDDGESEKLTRLMTDYEDMQIRHLSLPGDEHTTVYLREDMINYVVGGKGVKCFVHTPNNEYLVRMLLKDLELHLPNYYYRCHASYIINLRNVLYLSSKDITLTDGTKIPISVKRYREIKEDIDAWMNKT